MTLTTTLTIEELLRLPGEAVIELVLAAKTSPEFIRATLAAESAGKCRWVILNRFRAILSKA